MSVLYEHYYEPTESIVSPVDPDSLAAMNVVIYDSVRQDYAIAMIWHDGCIRREWGVVRAIDRVARTIKLVRDDGVWWVPIEKMLQVERV